MNHNNEPNIYLNKDIFQNDKSQGITQSIFNPVNQSTVSKRKPVQNLLNKEQDLLDYDQTSSDEEIIGTSFNIRHQDQNSGLKFIPGNKIHRIFTQHENSYRKQFYKKSQGIIEHPNGEEESYTDYYNKVEGEILEKQAKLKQKKKKLKKYLGRDEHINS